MRNQKPVTPESVAKRNKELEQHMLSPEEQRALTPKERAEVFAMTLHVMIRDMASGTITPEIFANTFRTLLENQFREAEKRVVDERDFYKGYCERLHNALVNDEAFDSGDLAQWSKDYEQALSKRQAKPAQEQADAVQKRLNCGHDPHDPYCEGEVCRTGG